MSKFRDFVTYPLVKLAFPDDQYIKEEHTKKQIVLHHTASGRGVSGDYRHWLNDPKRIATCVIVDYKGSINQLFSSKYWGYHLGVKNSQIKHAGVYTSASNSKELNEISIGIEIDSWGQLKKIGNEYVAYPNDFGKGDLKDKKGNPIKVVVPEERVQRYDNKFKGYTFYEKYTCEQIEATKQLLLYWNCVYGIPLDYCEDIWGVTSRALGQEYGIFTHNSYRSDKRDVHPQPELIEMLKSLK